MFFLQGEIRSILPVSKGSGNKTGEENVPVISVESLGVSFLIVELEYMTVLRYNLKYSIHGQWLM